MSGWKIEKKTSRSSEHYFLRGTLSPSGTSSISFYKDDRWVLVSVKINTDIELSPWEAPTDETFATNYQNANSFDLVSELLYLIKSWTIFTLN